MDRKLARINPEDDTPPGPNGRRCGTCKAFCSLSTGGECRLHGPVGVLIPGPGGAPVGIGFWPSTREHQWCLDWLS